MALFFIENKIRSIKNAYDSIDHPSPQNGCNYQHSKLLRRRPLRVNDPATPQCPPWPSSVCPRQESVLFIFYNTRRSRLTAFTYHCSSLCLRRKTAHQDHKRPYSGPTEPEEFQMSTEFANANIGKKHMKRNYLSFD